MVFGLRYKLVGRSVGSQKPPLWEHRKLRKKEREEKELKKYKTWRKHERMDQRMLKMLFHVFCYRFGSHKNLNQDQQVFYLLCKSVINGSLMKDLVGRALGPLCHSRWLTLGAHISCHYMRTKNPCNKLVTLTEFVVRAYGLVWFRARQ